MRFKDLKIGQHLWVLANDELLMVAKFNEDGYEVCGAWECGIGEHECEIVELVNVPKGHENTKLYYGEQLCEVCDGDGVFETSDGFIADCPRCN